MEKTKRGNLLVAFIIKKKMKIGQLERDRKPLAYLPKTKRNSLVWFPRKVGEKEVEQN